MLARPQALPISVHSGGRRITQYAAYLGIDWADKKHDLCLVDATSGKKTKRVLAHTPQAIAEYFRVKPASLAGSTSFANPKSRSFA